MNKSKVKFLVNTLAVLALCTSMLSVKSYSRYLSQAENDRMGELYQQGYPLDVAGDQAAEEFGYEGGLGTGGLDGLKLDGTPAPNAKPGTKG